MKPSLLIPLDGSPNGEAAIPVAAALARSAHAAVRLVMVAEPGVTPGEAYMREIANRLRSPAIPEVEIDVRTGSAAESVNECVSEHVPDLIVMATHGQGPVSGEWLGSVTERLLRTTSAPVLLVRRPDGKAITSERRALVLVDPSEAGLSILGPLADYACLAEAHVTLLTVLPLSPGSTSPASPSHAPPIESVVRHHQRRLDRAADDLRVRGIRVAARVMAAEDVVGTILDELNAGHATLVALSLRCTSERGNVGSVADKIIRGARKPVLILPLARSDGESPALNGGASWHGPANQQPGHPEGLPASSPMLKPVLI